MLAILKFKKLKYFILIIVLLSLLLVSHYTGLLRPLESLISLVISPIQKQLYSAGIIINQPRLDSTGLIAENKNLKEKNRQLIEDNIQLELEIEQLLAANKELLFLKENYPQRPIVTAHVLGRKIGDPYVLVIDKGEADGIIKDLPVVVDDGYLIGKIIKVKPQTSQLLLINSDQSLVSALILDSANDSNKIVSGEHGLSLKLDLIPQDEQIQKEDIVITSGSELTIPKGLVIGKVESINSDINQLFQTATLNLMVSLENLSVVSIILPPQQLSHDS